MATASDEELSFNCSPPGSVDSAANGRLTPVIAKSPGEDGEEMNGEYGAGVKRKLIRKDGKICSICGDTALGCNFDAISCESCKAFFRRNALKDKKTKCVFTGHCNIDINTRKFCPHCRLLKCFAVGMKKELILGDAEREKRRQKVQKNREIRGSGGGPRKRARKGNGSEDTLSMVGSPMSPPAAPDQIGVFQSPEASPLSAAVQSSVKLEPSLPAEMPILQQAVQTMPEFVTLPPVSTITTGSPLTPVSSVAETPVATNVTALTAMSIASTVPQLTGVSALPSVSGVSPLPPVTYVATLPAVTAVPLQVAGGISMPPSPAASTTSQQSNLSCNLLNAANYMQMPDSTEVLACGLDDNNHRQMTQEENNILAELLQIYDLSFTADLEPLVHIKQLDPTLNQLVNQSSITVLRIIKFAKRLEEFVSLPQECQIGILKGTWIHILLLRSVSMYDCERDLWVTPRVAIPTEILKNATGYVQLHDDHVNYCKDIKAMIRDDITLITIMLVVVLFSPEGQHVTLRALISNVQDKYLLLLKHYIEWKYGFQKAADMYPELVAKMKKLKELAEVHGKYLLDVNPREIEPIMLEILDLK